MDFPFSELQLPGACAQNTGRYLVFPHVEWQLSVWPSFVEHLHEVITRAG